MTASITPFGEKWHMRRQAHRAFGKRQGRNVLTGNIPGAKYFGLVFIMIYSELKVMISGGDRNQTSTAFKATLQKINT